MTQHVVAGIGIGLAAVGMTALLIGFLAITGVKKHGHQATWQGGVMLVAGIFLAGAVSIGYGVTEWNNDHRSTPGGASYSGPLQDPAPGNGCAAGPLTC